MSPPKILFFSDIHLDAKTDGRLRLNELEQVLDFCYGLVKSENVDVVVFGGDACDPDGPYAFKCVEALAAFDRDCLQANSSPPIRYYVNGNHDICEDGFGTSVLSPLTGIHANVIAEPVTHEWRGYTIGFLPHPSRANAYDPEKAIANWSAPDIIFGHLSIPGITPGSESQEMARGREHCWPAKEIKKRFPKALCFGGHYHRGDDYLLDGLHIQVVGSPARFTHGEEQNTPRVAIIQGNTTRWVPIPNARQLATVSLGAPAKWPSEFGKDAIVRLRHGPGATSEQLAQAAVHLRGMGADLVKFDLSENEAAAPIAEVTAEDGFAIAEQLARDIRTGEALLDQAIVDLTKVLAEDART